MLRTRPWRISHLSLGELFQLRRRTLSHSADGFVPSPITLAKNLAVPRRNVEDFAIEHLVPLAAARGGVALPVSIEARVSMTPGPGSGAAIHSAAAAFVPDYDWWRRLALAAGRRRLSRYGAWLLHRKLVRVLSQRLALEELWRLCGEEIARERVEEPIILFGLPRSQCHLLAHLLGRSGFVLTPTNKDSMFPGIQTDTGRRAAYLRETRFFQAANPSFSVVRAMIGPDHIDDDVQMHMLVPYALEWGLLCGLDEHLMAAMQEDQAGVYKLTVRLLQTFQWYKRNGQFTDAVDREINPINNMLQEQREGYKGVLSHQSWCLHSPLAILSPHSLHQAFPDMRLIWVHRTLSPAVASLCSALAMHEALYSGRGPTETQLAKIGEKVCGLFGSGSELSVDYLASFPQERMLHMSTIDLARHSARMAQRVLEYCGIDVDKWRKMQAVSAQSEYTDYGRPKHEHRLTSFGLHEGIITEVFEAYIFQFPDYAFYEMPGLRLAEARKDGPQLSGSSHAGLETPQTAHGYIASGDSDNFKGKR